SRSRKEEYDTLMSAIGLAGFNALFAGVLYLAVEPLARGRWAWRLSSWSRLLSGRVRDPLVGRDGLIGGAAGGGSGLAVWAVARLLLGAPQLLVLPGPDLSADRFPPGPIYATAVSVVYGAELAFALLMVALILSLVLRKEWLVWPAWVVLLTWVTVAGGEGEQVTAALAAVALLGWSLSAFVIARFGLLAACAQWFGAVFFTRVPLTTDTQAWYFWHGIAGAAIYLLVVLAAFHTAAAGQK